MTATQTPSEMSFTDYRYIVHRIQYKLCSLKYKCLQWCGLQCLEVDGWNVPFCVWEHWREILMFRDSPQLGKEPTFLCRNVAALQYVIGKSGTNSRRTCTSHHRPSNNSDMVLNWTFSTNISNSFTARLRDIFGCKISVVENVYIYNEYLLRIPR